MNQKEKKFKDKSIKIYPPITNIHIKNSFLKTDLIDLIEEKTISFDFVIIDFSNINNSKI